VAAACVTPEGSKIVKPLFWLLLLLRLSVGMAAALFPEQLVMRVPFAPTVFPSTGHRYVVYELHLTNFSASSMALDRLEVLDGDDPSARPIASFAGEQLDVLLQPVGASSTSGSTANVLRPGGTTVAYLWIEFDPGAIVPNRLVHRANSTIRGAVVTTHNTRLLRFTPPVQGSGWMASDGPSNAPGNHHRRGLLVFDGQPTISRRFAVDWMLYKGDASVSGDSHDVHSYYSYGKPVVAVANATVIKARDGLPDNVPSLPETFHPAVPITMDTVGGNTITLDLGNGQYAWYLHLQPGSLRVGAGDRVSRGQVLALIGCSGDPTVPHLHFEVTTSRNLVAGEGVPYLIDHYRVWTKDNVWQPRTGELPLGGMLVDFGQAPPGR
jgi:hypothetical protein